MSFGNSYAYSLSETDAAISVERFEITGGLDKEKETESTFDETKIISGSAKEGTSITVSVYQPSIKENEEEKELIEIQSYELEVGSSGRFMQSVNLSLGENYIVITAQDNDGSSEETFMVKRKEMQIKNELEQNIALPGQKSSGCNPKI